MQIKGKTPAKINLTLEIVGKRPDGFHDIKSIMQMINLYDYLTFDIEDSEEQIENQLKEKWTDEEMFKITHDKMRWLEFKYRFVEVES